jgi:hypothetical protein
VKENGSFYRKIFRDITLGYSKTSIEGQDVFVKHLNAHDQVDLEDLYDKYSKEAEVRGIPTEKEMLELLTEDDQWTQKDEDYIKNQNTFIESLIASKKHNVLKSQKDEKDKIIEKERDALNEKLRQRSGLLGNTCEKYAENRVNDYYIIKSFYKDDKIETPFFSEDKFDELDQKDLTKIIIKYNVEFKRFADINLFHLILDQFYQVYFPFCEDCLQFYGKPVCNITHNQIKLISYTRLFKHILENNPNIPESIKNDPEALIDYGTTSDKEKEKIQSELEKEGATTIVGAKKEDYEYLGVETGVETKNISLYDEAKKKGGSLSMEDLIKLSG